MAEFTLSIDGMHCGACIGRAHHALESIEGVQVLEVRLGTARLASNLETVPADLAVAALAKAGFTARLEE